MSRNLNETSRTSPRTSIHVPCPSNRAKLGLTDPWWMDELQTARPPPMINPDHFELVHGSADVRASGPSAWCVVRRSEGLQFACIP